MRLKQKPIREVGGKKTEARNSQITLKMSSKIEMKRTLGPAPRNLSFLVFFDNVGKVDDSEFYSFILCIYELKASESMKFDRQKINKKDGINNYKLSNNSPLNLHLKINKIQLYYLPVTWKSYLHKEYQKKKAFLLHQKSRIVITELTDIASSQIEIIILQCYP